MPEPLTHLYVHLVWSTWDRMPLLSAMIKPRVHVFLNGECRRIGALPIAIGGIDDHVHVLVRMPAALSVAALVKQLKGSSSHFVNHEIPKSGGFRWQGAYGAFTIVQAQRAGCP